MRLRVPALPGILVLDDWTLRVHVHPSHDLTTHARGDELIRAWFRAWRGTLPSPLPRVRGEWRVGASAIGHVGYQARRASSSRWREGRGNAEMWKWAEGRVTASPGILIVRFIQIENCVHDPTPPQPLKRVSYSARDTLEFYCPTFSGATPRLLAERYSANFIWRSILRASTRCRCNSHIATPLLRRAPACSARDRRHTVTDSQSHADPMHAETMIGQNFVNSIGHLATLCTVFSILALLLL
ncbi:hypothetical protein B0H17DRAFT_1144379 [Mycena rosella]|uniref:Uncharacterized protein n=1 Tax=Mycena rosella TaxID=1033263 RepID=A0AAD7G3G8_MYCRO|nr:hypothetical protein B0H17DRAFT_1144379 [Mycena rosella]